MRPLTDNVAAGILVILALAGLVVYAVRALASRRPSDIATPSPDVTPLALAFFALCTLSLGAALAYSDYTFLKATGLDRGLQGRYYLMPIAGQMALLAVGWMAWLPQRWQPAGHALVRLSAVALNAIALFGFVTPRYYG